MELEAGAGMVFNKVPDKYFSPLPSRHMIGLYFPTPEN